ncbi:MAG: hypothetical protein PHE33_01815 [Bacteroidales bacterium]|nr:hypothetical protein [Bacteroidales bacterium]
MKKSKIWISINSFFAFVSAFLVMKGIIAVSRFIVIRSFSGSTQMENFELDCITWKYSEFWTSTSVVSIYTIGLLVSAATIILSYMLYRHFRTRKGFLKLWFAWLFVISINQSIGLFIRDIPFKRDLYHALNWMFIPYEVMIAISILTVPALYFINVGNDIKFLRIAPTYDDLLSNHRRRKFYTIVALIPAIAGSIFLLLMRFHNIQLFELSELFLLIGCICISYTQFLKDELIVEFKIVKNENSNKLNLFVLSLFIISIAIFYYFSVKYF